MGICSECSKKISGLEKEIESLKNENESLKKFNERVERGWVLIQRCVNTRWKLCLSESDRFYKEYEKHGDKADWKRAYAYQNTCGGYREIITLLEDYGNSDEKLLDLLEAEINEMESKVVGVQGGDTELSGLEKEYGLLKKKWSVLKKYVDTSAKLDLKKENKYSHISSIISELESGDDMGILDSFEIELDELKKLM